MFLCREYTPGPYFTADQLAELKGQATITIQRFTRGWLARRRARRLEMLKGEREDFLMTQVCCTVLSITGQTFKMRPLKCYHYVLEGVNELEIWPNSGKQEQWCAAA